MVFLFCVFLSLWVLLPSVGRLQLRENGMNLYDRFVDWDWIEAYCWGLESHMLYLQGKDRIFHSVLLSQPYQVAPKHRDIVDEWLKQRFGSQSIVR